MRRLTKVIGVSLIAVGVAVGLAGCGPSDWIYAIGVARVGDTYHLLAPLCDDESIEAVEILDNAAAGSKESFSPEDTTFTYWWAEDPEKVSVERGLIPLGEDAGYRKVIVPAGSKISFPTTAGALVRVTGPKGWKWLGDGFRAAEVPTYGATDDPKAVKYRISNDDGVYELLTPAEISKQRKRCALENAG